MSRLLPLAVVLALFATLTGRTLGETIQKEDEKPKRVKVLDELADRKVTMDLKEATLKDSLDRLFKLVPVNRVMMFNSSIDTKITLKVENVPFEGALMCILRSVKKMQLRYEAAGELLMITEAGSSGERVSAANKKVWADLENVDVRYAVKALLGLTRANYVLDQNVTGQVTTVIVAEPYDAALDKLCRNEKAPVSFTVDADGLFKFSAAK